MICKNDIKIYKGDWFAPEEGEAHEYSFLCKGKYRCSRCKNADDFRNWTTGCCTLNLHVTKLGGIGAPKEVEIIVKGWSQECNICEKAGDIGMYQDEIERVSEKMAERIVWLYFRPPKKSKGEKP